jgi:hypothetical protein
VTTTLGKPFPVVIPAMTTPNVPLREPDVGQ